MPTSNRETAGVGLAFVGFVVIVLGFKGTWKKVFNDLWNSNASGFNPADPAGTGYTGPTLTNPGTTPGTVVPGTNGGPNYLVPVDPNAPTVPLNPPASFRLPNSRVSTPSSFLT